MPRQVPKVLACLAFALALAWWLSGTRDVDQDVGAPKAGEVSILRTTALRPSARAGLRDIRALPIDNGAASLRMTSQARLAVEAAAATRAYEALKICVDAQRASAYLADPAHVAELEQFSRAVGTEPPGPSGPAWQRHVLDVVARQLEVVRRAKTECVDLGTRTTDGSIYALARRAAVLGDRDAAACYVSMHWPMDEAHWNDPTMQQAYRTAAPALIDAGIAAGEWRMVYLAQTAANSAGPAVSPPGAPVWLTPGYRWLQSLHPDPVRALALVRLQEAGSADPGSAEGDRRLGDALALGLTPAQAQQASAWADLTFRRAFHGERRSRNEMVPTCE